MNKTGLSLVRKHLKEHKKCDLGYSHAKAYNSMINVAKVIVCLPVLITLVNKQVHRFRVPMALMKSEDNEQCAVKVQAMPLRFIIYLSHCDNLSSQRTY